MVNFRQEIDSLEKLYFERYELRDALFKLKKKQIALKLKDTKEYENYLEHEKAIIKQLAENFNQVTAIFDKPLN